MKTLTSEITIGTYTVSNLVSVVVEKTAEMLQDTAEITLPAMVYGRTLNIDDRIKRGDAVSISLGYDGQNQREFTGYVTAIRCDDRIIIACEDGVFQFRKAVANKEYKSISVVDLVRDIAQQVGGFSVVAGEGVDGIRFDKFTVNEADGAQVLQKIKEQTKLNIYLRGAELHLSLPYAEKVGEATYDFSKNIQKSSLKWRTAQDRKVLVKIIGIAKDNQRTEVKVGEKGGDEITLHKYNITDKKTLRDIGTSTLEKYRIDGYDGDITAWLEPFATFGTYARILDGDYPNRQGTYYVKAVKVSFSALGGQRILTLGKKIQ